MKKKIYIIVSAVLLVITLTGCFKKNMEADEVGSLFVDHFIYQKKDAEFKENFVDGELLSKQLLLMTSTFEDTFSNVFDSVATDFSPEEKNQLSTGLMKSVTEKIDKNRIQVTYTIHGLDYSDLVEKTLESIFKELMKNPEYSDESGKKGLLQAFDQSLESAKSVEKSVEVSLVFEKNKKKWELSENQDDELEELLFSFISGTNDKVQYEKDMNQMLERAIKNASNSL
jgi:hypothetical protein